MKKQLANMNKSMNKIKQQIDIDKRNNKNICIFSNINIAANRDIDLIPSNLFTNYNELKSTFKKLNNKKSSGLDNIPTSLKKSTTFIIYDYQPTNY